MFLTEPGPSPLDVNFRLGDVPVRITPWFWVVHGGIGLWLGTTFHVAYLFFWVGAILLSLLVHEFGHVLAGKAFGSHGRIVLTPLFGLALECADHDEPRKRALVYAAGPAAQLLLAGVLWPVYANLDWPEFRQPPVSASQEKLEQWVQDSERDMARLEYLTMLAILMDMNVVWPLFNLLPVPPLDGWHIFRALREGRGGGRAPWERDADWWKRG